MSEASPSQELECLRRLAAQPGAAWAGLLAPSQPGLLAVGADGAERPADAATSVLVQGMLAAAAALAQRFDLGPPASFEQHFLGGSLLIRCLEDGRGLVLAGKAGHPAALLRLALNEAAASLPPAAAPQAAAAWHDSSFGTNLPEAVFSATTAPFQPGHAGICNPFSST